MQGYKEGFLEEVIQTESCLQIDIVRMFTKLEYGYLPLGAYLCVFGNQTQRSKHRDPFSLWGPCHLSLSL